MYSVQGRYVAVCVVVILVASSTRLNWRKTFGRYAPRFLNLQLPRELPDPEEPPPPSPSLEHSFRKAAVCTDGNPCSSIGRDILAKGGSAVDAAVAALFCNGVVNMQSMALGGGFIMTVYQRKTKTAHALVARDTAPGAAKKDMFARKLHKSDDGALATGVPGELRGYREAHEKFGRLPWADLVQPTIKICEEGFRMSEYTESCLKNRFRFIFSLNDPNLREWFVDKKGRLKTKGSLIRPRQLCETLKVIAQEGGKALHDGSLTKTFVEDVQNMGGLITEDDMRNYKPEWTDPITVKLQDDTVYTSPPPGAGVLLTFILKILEGYNLTPDSVSTLDKMTTTVHRMVEAFKYAYAKRTELGDPLFVDIKKQLADLMSEDYINNIRSQIKDDQTFDKATHYGAVYYNPDDHGTSHISILAPDGDAVAVTSTVNKYFGAGITSKRTGILLNSGMDDFSIPDETHFNGVHPAPANFIEPGKRPMSSTCPTIIVDSNGDVRMVVGAAGSTHITTAVSWVIIQYLWLGKSIKEAVDARRFHHQLYPMELDYGYGVTSPLVKSLEKLGHKMYRFGARGSIVCAIAKKDDRIYANADFRKDSSNVCGID
ncbi:glutathione hydrolase 1 proenzyme-like [Macrosteles quadrilineatus]|uniref:glutathione hydrolase 1 proenzyme-like n=1 Tax=Macrosteles quadrilineatus TaxID=74068 RepID=UPI0023E2E011|nr:glutathione hydrolase 1 proenzyme-like [Macrosteles quadrilineatus]